MALLVIFDVPAVKPRGNLQRALNRMGFFRLFPNTYERQENSHFRIYSIQERSTMRERWGKSSRWCRNTYLSLSDH